jgi:hypothetical protein
MVAAIFCGMAHRTSVLASLGVAGALFLTGPVWAEAPVTVAVEASGELPGFNIGGAVPYLAAQMNAAGITAWHFVPRDADSAAPNRIEWQFELLPYAGGEVRRFFPMPEAQRTMDVHLQGTHRLISAEARLYLDGQYQTVTFSQQAVQGGAGDPDLASLLVQVTRNLESGYRAIDMTPAIPNRTAP